MIQNRMCFHVARRARVCFKVCLLALPMLLSGCFDFQDDEPKPFTPQELKSITPPLNEVFESEISQEQYYRANYSTSHVDTCKAYVQRRVEDGWEAKGSEYSLVFDRIRYQQDLMKTISDRRVSLIVRCRIGWEGDTGSSLSVSN